MRLNYIFIPLITILVAWLGARFTSRGVREWYPSLRKPKWTPPGAVIGAVWTVLYILAAASALIIWNISAPGAAIVTLFIANAVLNVLWSWTFFAHQKIYAAVWVCLALDVTIVALIRIVAPISAVAAWLLVPYAAWVTFAAYLNYRVASMNGRIPR